MPNQVDPLHTQIQDFLVKELQICQHTEFEYNIATYHFEYIANSLFAHQKLKEF